MSYSLFIHFKNRSTLIQAIVYTIAVNWLAKIIHRYLWHMASGFSPPHSSQQWCAQKRTHLQPFCSKFDIVWAGREVFSYQSQYKNFCPLLMCENRPRATIRTYPRLPFVQLITGSWFGKLLMIIEYVDFNQAKYVSQLITLLNH